MDHETFFLESPSSISSSLLAGVQQQVHELVSGLGIGNEQGRRTVSCDESEY